MSSINNDIYNHIHATWWKEDGFMAMLRTSVNPPRFDYFRKILLDRLTLDPRRISVLDVGCGGGYLAEQFAAIGCAVTGVDRSVPTLKTAMAHALTDGYTIHYIEGSGEKLPFEVHQFDVVCCCDVLEHVDDIDIVISEIARVLKPGGVFFYDTINRTLKSKLVAIKLAQDWPLTRFIPRDVHVWDKFIRPLELINSLDKQGLINQEMTGRALKISPIKALFHYARQKFGKLSFAELGTKLMLAESNDLDISYMGFAVRAIRWQDDLRQSIVGKAEGMTVDKNATEIKVFYNSGCPVCDVGISIQKNKMNTCAVAWKDVHTDMVARNELPANLELVRERLHAIDEKGNLRVGIDAFEVIWRHSPNEQWKANLIAWPIIKPLSTVAYNLFAKLLYRWNVKKGHWKIS